MKTLKLIGKILAVLIVAMAVLYLWHIIPIIWNLKQEYVTAGVIGATYKYVEKTGGKWPQSWNDLNGNYSSSYTKMNFTLDTATATEQDVLTAIVPISGKYYTYPHANQNLKAIWQMVKMYQESPDGK